MFLQHPEASNKLLLLQAPPEPPAMPLCYHGAMIRYLDTRGLDDPVPTFTGAVIKGIAPAAACTCPRRCRCCRSPRSSRSPTALPRARGAVFDAFEIDVPAERVDALMAEAYGDQLDDARIAPVREVAPDMHVLELWHGPTSAFKDMALQCMPLFFSEAARCAAKRASGSTTISILVATSGDTGKAALEGFADRDHTRIVVFYPATASPTSSASRWSRSAATTSAVFGVRGNFDDCQNAVKAAFADTGVHDRAARAARRSSCRAPTPSTGAGCCRRSSTTLSAYADMVAAGGVRARRADRRLRAHRQLRQHPGAATTPSASACRSGDCCARATRTTCWPTSSPPASTTSRAATFSHDPLAFAWTSSISTNLERLLFELTLRRPRPVASWMRRAGRRRAVPSWTATRSPQMRELLRGRLGRQRRVARRRSAACGTRRGYLLDPHTAVAWEVAERLRGADPVLVVSTAHWAKFGARRLQGARAACRTTTPLPDGRARADRRRAARRRCRSFAPEGACVPKTLAELDAAEVRFPRVVGAGSEGVERAVREWLG